jgi:ABC-type phosphate/phosphonate transport system permease subunit
MKKQLLLIASLFSCATFAHEDHYLNTTVHEYYHIAFYVLLMLVVIKAVHWVSNKLRKRSQ